SNDVLGADRPDSVTGVAAGTSTATPISGGVGSAINTSLGTLTLAADGSYTYTAKPNTTGGTDHFVYTLTDADGSTSTTTLNITVGADTLAAKSDSVTVDESGLPTGSTPGNGSNIGSGTLTGDVTGGSGGDTFSLVSQTGAHGTVTLDPTGAYTYTLTSADPGAGRPATEQVDSFTYKVTDSLGNSVTNTVSVNDVEDHPSIAPANASTADNATVASPIVATANLNFVAGADQPTTITSLVDTGDDNGGSPGAVTSGGVALVYATVGDTLTATAGVGGPTVFTLTETPGTGAAPGTGTYTFTLDQPLDGPFVPISTFSSGGFGAGPNAQGQELKDLGTATPIALLAGFDTTAGFALGGGAGGTDIGATHPDANVGGVNGATAGFGIDSNTFTNDQLFVVEFQQGTAFLNTGLGGFNPPAFAGPAVNATTFGFTKATTGEYQIHYTDGSTGAVTSFTNATSISISAGKDISYIEILNTGSSNGKFILGSASAEQQVADAQLNFSTTVTDADGTTSTGTFHVSVTGPTTPIVLDLTGDGVQFVGESAGVTFNYGSGLVSTAWAAPGDGVLALNTGGGRVVNFGVNGGTDLQGLAAYDTNHDGKLDAGDTSFSKFGAIVNGQFETLSQLGISSVNLSSNNTPYTAAGGQVQVAGTGTFTYANGKTGSFADASFATAPVSPQNDLAVNENAGLAAAAAAASVLAASFGADPPQSHTQTTSETSTNGVTVHADDVPQLDHQVALQNGSAALDSTPATFAPAAEGSHTPTGMPTANSIDLSSLSSLDPSSSHLGASSHSHLAAMFAPQSVSALPGTLANAAFAGGPSSVHGAHDGVVHGGQAAAPLIANVLADALPGAGHNHAHSLASLIEGLPTGTGQIIAPTAGGAGAAAAAFHAAMMGPGFGAFEFGNELATLTHHSLAVAAHA
ncbi:MAG TPA: Ig-like domain-containing protein, partial [Caulobacteraceae bacterium]|nr:Ig-like domain-containing protein [Caulobacteraceae bacterium]